MSACLIDGVWVGLAKLSYPRFLRSETRGGRVRDIAEDVRCSLHRSCPSALNGEIFQHWMCKYLCTGIPCWHAACHYPRYAAIADRSVRVSGVWAFGEVAAMPEFGNARSTSSQKMLSFAKQFQRFETLLDLQGGALWIAY